MQHTWECLRCTQQWHTYCCSGHFGKELSRDEEYVKSTRHRRKLNSRLCYSCYPMLEVGTLEGLPLFNLYDYLDSKADRYQDAARFDGKYVHKEIYSGMCHPYKSNYDTGKPYPYISNYVSGATAEHIQLYDIVADMFKVYADLIRAQRTIKRIELDKWREDQNPTPQVRVGWLLTGGGRPDEFVGD